MPNSSQAQAPEVHGWQSTPGSEELRGGTLGFCLREQVTEVRTGGHAGGLGKRTERFVPAMMVLERLPTTAPRVSAVPVSYCALTTTVW